MKAIHFFRNLLCGPRPLATEFTAAANKDPPLNSDQQQKQFFDFCRTNGIDSRAPLDPGAPEPQASESKVPPGARAAQMWLALSHGDADVVAQRCVCVLDT